MNTTRRGFLGALLAASATPAIVRAQSLMPLYVPPKLVLWGDGVHDDTDAAQAVLDGRRGVRTPAGLIVPAGMLIGHTMRISRTLVMRGGSLTISGCCISVADAVDTFLQVEKCENVSMRNSIVRVDGRLFDIA